MDLTSKCRALPIRQDIAYWFCFTEAETEMDKIKDDSKIKREINLHRHGLRPIPNVCHLPDPPVFSLQTTFKGINSREEYFCWRSYRSKQYFLKAARDPENCSESLPWVYSGENYQW